MTTQHTPGPWISHPSPRGHAIDIYDGRDGTPFEPLATVTLCEKRQHGIRLTDERQGNARLIATAPDLLATLRIIHANAAESVEWIRRHTAEAIARATGEEVTQ